LVIPAIWKIVCIGHTNSGSKATKKASDWKIVYTQQFEAKAEAYQREFEIKNKKSRKYIESLIK